MSERLTDEELAEMRALVNSWTPVLGEPEINETRMAVLSNAAMRELIELRSLLSASLPCGWDEPRVVVSGSTRLVACEWLGPEPISHEEAQGLAADLMRAVVAARGGAR